MSPPQNYRISLAMRDKQTKKMIKERILESAFADINHLTQGYIKHIEKFKKKNSRNIEMLKPQGYDYSIEILDGDNRISYSPIS